MRDLHRFTRNIRNENRNTISVGKGEPKSFEGIDGDIRVNSTTGGVKLFTKYKGQWWSTGLSKIENVPEVVNELQFQSADTFVTDSTGGTVGNEIANTTGVANNSGDSDAVPTVVEFENAIATLASKINSMAVILNKIIKRLQ